MSEKPETRIMRNQVAIMHALSVLTAPHSIPMVRKLEHYMRRTEENILLTSGEYSHAEAMHKREGD